MRLRNRGFGVVLFVIVFLCAVSVAAAQTIVSPNPGVCRQGRHEDRRHRDGAIGHCVDGIE